MQEQIEITRAAFNKACGQGLFVEIYEEHAIDAFDNRLEKALRVDLPLGMTSEGEIEKAAKNRSGLVKMVITDKNGHKKTVWVKPKGDTSKKSKAKDKPNSSDKKTSSEELSEDLGELIFNGGKNPKEIETILTELSSRGVSGNKLQQMVIGTPYGVPKSEIKDMKDELEEIELSFLGKKNYKGKGDAEIGKDIAEKLLASGADSRDIKIGVTELKRRGVKDTSAIEKIVMKNIYGIPASKINSKKRQLNKVISEIGS